MECTETSCEGGKRCCVNINYYPGFYCKIVSQCEQEPIWQVIVIPALLAFLALALGIMICLKLRGKKRSKRTVASYVKQQMYSIQLTQPDETQTRNASYPKYKHLRFDANNRLKLDIETDRDRSNPELQKDGHRSQQSKLTEKMMKYFNFYSYGKRLMANYS